MAGGMCAPCYLARYRNDPTHAERAYESKHAWYVRNVTRDDQRAIREDRDFGGRRAEVLERDGHKCADCGQMTGLVVHHIDGQGRPVEPIAKNNSLENLITLCRACHARRHRLCTGRWSIIADACLECSRTDRVHNAHGLCVACYSRKRYKMKIQSDLHSDMQSTAEMSVPGSAE